MTKINSKRLLWSLNSQPTDHQSAIITNTLKSQLWVRDTERKLFSNLQPCMTGSRWIKVIHLIEWIQYEIGKTRLAFICMCKAYFLWCSWTHCVYIHNTLNWLFCSDQLNSCLSTKMEVYFGRRKSGPTEEGRIDFQYFTSVHIHQTTF